MLASTLLLVAVSVRAALMPFHPAGVGELVALNVATLASLGLLGWVTVKVRDAALRPDRPEPRAARVGLVAAFLAAFLVAALASFQEPTFHGPAVLLPLPWLAFTYVAARSLWTQAGQRSRAWAAVGLGAGAAWVLFAAATAVAGVMTQLGEDAGYVASAFATSGVIATASAACLTRAVWCADAGVPAAREPLAAEAERRDPVPGVRKALLWAFGLMAYAPAASLLFILASGTHSPRWAMVVALSGTLAFVAGVALLVVANARSRGARAADHAPWPNRAPDIGLGLLIAALVLGFAGSAFGRLPIVSVLQSGLAGAALAAAGAVFLWRGQGRTVHSLVLGAGTILVVATAAAATAATTAAVTAAAASSGTAQPAATGLVLGGGVLVNGLLAWAAWLRLQETNGALGRDHAGDAPTG